jgi:hypothetical protein
VGGAVGTSVGGAVGASVGGCASTSGAASAAGASLSADSATALPNRGLFAPFTGSAFKILPAGKFGMPANSINTHRKLAITERILRICDPSLFIFNNYILDISILDDYTTIIPIFSKRGINNPMYSMFIARAQFVSILRHFTILWYNNGSVFSDRAVVCLRNLR